MVQTHSSPRSLPLHYWKVQAGGISDEVYRRRLRAHLPKHCPKNMRLKFAAIDSRAQRGMLLYEKCTAVELLAFCDQRDINTGPTSLDKAGLINLLQTADEATVFDSFDKLPAELRQSIYGFSFEFFKRPSLRSSARNSDSDSLNTFKLAPPPIASVSRLLRRETLPLFYGSDNLILQTQVIHENSMYYHQSRYRLAGNLDHGRFFSRAPLSLRSLVRNVTFSVSTHYEQYNASGAFMGTGTFTRRVEAKLRPDGALEEVKVSPPRVLTLDGTTEKNVSQPDDLQQMVSGLSPDNWVEQLRKICRKAEQASGGY